MNGDSRMATRKSGEGKRGRKRREDLGKIKTWKGRGREQKEAKEKKKAGRVGRSRLRKRLLTRRELWKENI